MRLDELEGTYQEKKKNGRTGPTKFKDASQIICFVVKLLKLTYNMINKI